MQIASALFSAMFFLIPPVLSGQTVRNLDPVYVSLRSAAPVESFVAEEILLQRDCATLRLKKGVISFAAPVMGKVTLAVFTGQGEFRLDPANPIERAYVRTISGAEVVEEPFQRAVLVFTDETYEELRRAAGSPAADANATAALAQHRDRVRQRPENPRGFSESLLTSELMDNLEADVLAWLYNPARPVMFNAYVQGQKRKDLRFYLRGLGAIAELASPEQVALININPGGDNDGVWYHSHPAKHLESKGYLIEGDTRAVQAVSYSIETTLEGTRKLNGKTKVTLRGVIDGERVVKFGLLPDLRVEAVEDGGGRPAGFIQEDRNADGSFYVILPEPLKTGETVTLTIRYAGDKVLTDAGGGSTYVDARTSWYPSLNSFRDRTPYDLVFKAPKKFTVVASGRKVKSWDEGRLACTQWRSEAPHAVAGFNVGMYKSKEVTERKTNTKLEGYATREAPNYLRDLSGEINIAPSGLLDSAMAQAEASLQVFTHWFGPLPYGHLAITQQPNFSMGQSWPELIYLPMSAFIDATTRYRLFDGINLKLTNFLDEVTPHEVSHQWWGHLVGWDSYRDQWLSEGLATFSAGLYLEATGRDTRKALQYWERARTSLFEKNRYGQRSVDAGPIFIGLRASTPRNAGAYQDLTYLKGGFVFHMLRMMMQDQKTGDVSYIAFMKDYVETHRNRNATLSSFTEVLNRHVQPHMDLTGTGSMAWFVHQWVLGTEIPRYELDWSAEPADGGYLLKATVAQTGVSSEFGMMVPVYLEHEGRLHRLGRVVLIGEQQRPLLVKLPFKPVKVVVNANLDVLANRN